jgi:hypothetical protein
MTGRSSTYCGNGGHREIKARKVRKGNLMHNINFCIHLSIQWTKKKIKNDSHRDHRAHREKILGALGVLGGKKYTLYTIKNQREY